MEFTYRIEKNERIVYLEGDYSSLEVWKQTMLAILDDPEFEAGYGILSDRRSFTVLPSAEFIRATVRFFQDHSQQIEGGKWATVVSTTAAFGMGRMAEILSEDVPGEMQIFTDIEKARQWLCSK